jgi:hypothetical protein
VAPPWRSCSNGGHRARARRLLRVREARRAVAGLACWLQRAKDVRAGEQRAVALARALAIAPRADACCDVGPCVLLVVGARGSGIAAAGVNVSTTGLPSVKGVFTLNLGLSLRPPRPQRVTSRA